MRTIVADEIRKSVAELVVSAVHELGDDVMSSLRVARDLEPEGRGRVVLDVILENAELAPREMIPLCQDTGSQVVLAEIGEEVQVIEGSLKKAVYDGVVEGTAQGYLRRSIVSDPLFERNNTGDNTPPFLHIEFVPGRDLRLVVLPKGGGCENMSTLKMLKPAEGEEGVKSFVLDSVRTGAVNSCPPLIVGVGIGGTFDTVGWLAKKALFRRIGSLNSDPKYSEMESELLAAVNQTGIGPMGWGGVTTALAVQIESAPTHIASLPVAVNFQCHSARIKERVL